MSEPPVNTFEDQDSDSVSVDGRGDRGLRALLRRLLVGLEGREIVLPAPPVPPREIFRYFWPYARPYRRWIVVSAALIFIVPAVQAAMLYMLKVVVDEALVPEKLTPFAWIAPVLLGLTALYGVLSFLQTYVSAWVGERFLVDLRTHFFRHLQGLSLDFFDRRRLGDILSRLTSDTNAIETFVLS